MYVACRSYPEVGDPEHVVPVSIRFSISALPSSPMQPRVADERVGYFTTVFKDLGDHRANRQGRGSDLLNTEVRRLEDYRTWGRGEGGPVSVIYSFFKRKRR